MAPNKDAVETVVEKVTLTSKIGNKYLTNANGVTE